MPKYKYCQKCKDPDVNFEGKFCSIECADLFDKIDVDQWEDNIKRK